jgi:hypothetical protein
MFLQDLAEAEKLQKNNKRMPLPGEFESVMSLATPPMGKDAEKKTGYESVCISGDDGKKTGDATAIAETGTTSEKPSNEPDAVTSVAVTTAAISKYAFTIVTDLLSNI